jgi:hypothetical protein
MPLLILLLLLPVILIVLTPVMLVQRYRVGTARREARPWLATFGLVMMAGSTIFFLTGAGVTSFWVQDAFLGALAGVAAGVVLGMAGLVLTKWEATPRSLHYTPNRWLVLLVTVIVSARLLYGLYRSWAAARAGIEGTAVITAFGIPESLGAGGAVIGYYLAYGAGLRWRIKKWQKRPLRVI